MNIKSMTKLLLVGLAVMAFLGTSTNRTSTAGKVNNFTWIKFNSVELAAATDSAYFILPSPPDLESMIGDTAWIVTISTQSANGDSVDLSVRWLTSYDNVSWESYTVGTDSTDWATTRQASSAEPWQPVSVTLSVHQVGLKPYNKIFVFGNTGNQTGGAGTGTKVKADVVRFD